MLKLRTILLYKYLYIIIFLLALIISLVNINFGNNVSIYQKPCNNIVGEIIDITVTSEKTKLLLKAKENILVIHYLKIDHQIGDIVHVEGEMLRPEDNSNFHLFNYKEYLENKRIFWIIKASNIKKEGFVKNFDNFLKNNVNKQISKILKSERIVKAFIKGDKSGIKEEIKYSYTYNGISHLLAVSGGHIAVIVAFLMLILKKIKDEKKYILILAILFIYTYINNFSPSLTRASLFFFLITINKLFYFHIKNLNLLFLTAAILLFLNPFYFMDIGFQYSFIISGFLIFNKEKLKKEDTYLIKALKVSLIAFLASFPLSIYHFSRVNLFSVIYNIFFCPFVGLILYPLSLVTFFLPKLDFFLIFFLEIMEKTSLFLTKIKIGNFILVKPSIFILLLSYFLLIISNFKSKFYLFLIILIFVHYNFNMFLFNPSLTMIDVGQGDCFLISSSQRKVNILIDTGGNIMNKNSNIAKNTIIPYLQFLGIRKVDYLILTHGDFDHLGEAQNLLEYFSVDKIVINDFGNNFYEKQLISKYNNKIKIFKEGKKLKFNNIEMEFLSPNRDLEENDNSLVFLMKVLNYKLLFMGDASSLIEKEITKKYDLENIDILKVGHHGSITSSCSEFIKTINPEIALISVGKNNLFNHPSNKVIENLQKNKIKIYQTSLNGAVYIEFKKDIKTIKKCL